MDGFEVLRRVREKSSVPVIMVTAREEERDKITGLDNGADDYITKPFSVRELIARIKANMRRNGTAAQAKSEAKENYGPFSVDRAMQQISKNGVPLELTQREYDLLNYFFASPDKVITREELMEKVWGYEYYGDLRAVDVAMRRLREKVEEDSANPEYIMTSRGVGYYIKL
jgi:two-component system response regulator VicR